MFHNVFKVIFLVGLITGSVIRVIYTKARKESRSATDCGTRLDRVLVSLASIGFIAPILYLATSRLDFADYRLPAWASWIGTAVFGGALWLLWRSHVDLGRNWSATPQIRKGHALITRGVYRTIRHPMYAAHWLWGVAQALLLSNWIAGPALLASFIPLYLVRVPREEEMMLRHFGEEYRLYINRTGRILPRLSR